MVVKCLSVVLDPTCDLHIADHLKKLSLVHFFFFSVSFIFNTKSIYGLYVQPNQTKLYMYLINSVFDKRKQHNGKPSSIKLERGTKCTHMELNTFC